MIDFRGEIDYNFGMGRVRIDISIPKIRRALYSSQRLTRFDLTSQAYRLRGLLLSKIAPRTPETMQQTEIYGVLRFMRGTPNNGGVNRSCAYTVGSDI